MSQYFNYDTDSMLGCSCGCGVKGMQPAFLDLLDVIRESVNEPMIITSGYRCPSHNQNVSSTGKTGPHTTGRAVDIRADSILRFKITKAAMEQGITRLGIAKSFIHIDDLGLLDGFPENRIWTY